jgi:Uma2 family endonuclease
MPYLTAEQYLGIERKAEYKSEYFRGEMFAMAGASRAHNLVAVNVLREVSAQLRHRQCEVYSGDMRVRVNPTGLYTYPDGVIVCGKPEFADTDLDTLVNPGVLIEIVSPSTEAYDRGRKFEQYRSVPSLREYLLISSERMHVDLFTRQPDGPWMLVSADKPEATIELTTIVCTLTLSALYEKIEF